MQARDVLAELRGVPLVPPGDRDTVLEAVGPCAVLPDGSAEMPDVLLLQGVPGIDDELGAEPRVRLRDDGSVGNAGLLDAPGRADGRQDRLGFVVVGDDDEGAAGEYLGEHVASLERARAVDQDGVEVAQLADPGELSGVQLMDDLVAGILHGPGEVVGVGLGVDVDHQGTAVRGNGVGGQRERDHRLAHAALLIEIDHIFTLQ